MCALHGLRVGNPSLKSITIRLDAPERDDYHILCMKDDVCLAQVRKRLRSDETALRDTLSSHACDGAREAHDGPRTRTKKGEEETSTLLMIKGSSTLIAHDMDNSYTVRRVEHSNSLLLLRPQAEITGSEATIPSSASDVCGVEGDVVKGASLDAVGSVVVATLTRTYELHQTRPSRNALTLLYRYPLTVSEMERCGDAGG